jgi:hypothetical protein
VTTATDTSPTPDAAATAEPTPASPDSTDHGAATSRRSHLLLALLVVAAVAIPVILVGVASLGDAWRPSGDWAVLAMRVGDVGADSPLVGPYSRYGWNHPGPMLYWALAGPYHLLGQQPVDLLFGTALLNGIAMAGTAALAWRRGRLPLLLLTALALALLAHGLGPEVLRDPWNPYITLAPMALFAFLMWSVADGERWPIPVSVLVGSFLVQSHIGYAVMVGALAATTVVLVTLEARRGSREKETEARRPRRLTALVVSTALVAGLCWAPVIVDQVDGSGNIGGLVEYFASSGEPSVGFVDATGYAARHLSLSDAPWLGAKEPSDPEGGGQIPASPVGLLAPVGAFVLAILAARRVGATSAVRFQVLVAAATVAGVLATSRITGEPYDYLLRWWWVMAALFWLSIAWSGCSALLRWVAVPTSVRRAAAWLGAPIALVMVLGTGASTALAGPRAEIPDASTTLILDELVEPTLDAFAGYGPVLVRSTGSAWGTAADGLRLELERAGIPVVADPNDAFRLGPERSSESLTPAVTLWVVSADAATNWKARPELRFIVEWDPLDPLARAGYLATSKSVQAQLTAAGRPDLARDLARGGDVPEAATIPGIDPTLLAKLADVHRKGDPVAVFLGAAP